MAVRERGRRPWHRRVRALGTWAFWLAVWALAAALVGSDLILPGPGEVLARLVASAALPSFWLRVGGTLGRVLVGFGAGMALAAALACLSLVSRLASELIAAPIALAKAVPVAAITVLALVWLRASGLSALVVLLVVVPLGYESLLAALRARSRGLDELACVLRVPWARAVRFLVLPPLMPALRAATSTGFGMAWKACVAAEVIAIPAGSVGEAFYTAKVQFDTTGVFAWTAAVVVLAVACGRALQLALSAVERWALAAGAGAGAAADPVPAACPQPGPGAGAVLAVQGVAKRFTGAALFAPCSFTVTPGAPVALMAPSGAGKTTLVRIIAGLSAPDEGAVALPAGARVAMVFQDDRLGEEATALANVRVALVRGSTAWREAPGLLAALGIGDVASRPVRTCSGGQRRRIALARALATPHDVLLLDEPFTGLDASARAQAASLVRTRERERIVVLTTHDPHDAALLGAHVVRLGAS